MEPGRAFDTISKVLFIKMYIERTGAHGTFTVEYLDQRAASRLGGEDEVHDRLFDLTKNHYKIDEIFGPTDKLEISEGTFRRIVRELARFNLSKTGNDIKGLEFEKFLSDTFRGDLGQFFNPRPVVEFMVSLLDPQEGQLICDPAAGSGGFLIRAFEHVRGLIADEIQIEMDKARAEIEAKGLDPEEEEKLIDEVFAKLNEELLPSGDDSKPIDTRVGRLAWQCIFGCDAEPRAARTAKMNMIMHGDGHGGIHYDDGLVDINGIFPGRFDIVITNPPFGSNVGSDQKIGGSEETRVPEDAAYISRCKAAYGEAWRQSHDAMQKALNTNILDLFEIGKGKKNRATEIVFVERCLKLLKPGGRMGIVLPDGNLNNPSLTWLRRWCEGKARILAVVSLPEETFSSAKATVKASLVFLRRFTKADETEVEAEPTVVEADETAAADTDEAAWEAAWTTAHALHDAAFGAKRDALCAELGPRVLSADRADIAKILADLSKLGIDRTVPAWTAGPNRPLIKSAGRDPLVEWR
jgi:type I restriction enzyme M protein